MQAKHNSLFFLFVFLAIAGGSVFTYLALNRPAVAPQYATVLPEPMPLPAFSLRDETGTEFDRDAFRGHWNLVFFGFTHCPDICPATLQQLALARHAVLESGAANFPQIVFVSVDPARDTEKVLASYIGHFGDGITGVGGDIAELRKLTTATGIFFAQSSASDENYSVDHSAVVLVINPAAEFHAVFSAPHTVEQFSHDIPLLTGSP